MAILTQSVSRSVPLPSFGLALGIMAVVTVVRLVGLKYSVVDLFFDESQYWAWSRELAFGYFSKPPLLAWIIWLAEHVCGSSDACIRAPSPVLYFGTGVLVYALARHLYDERVAFFASISLALATGAAFSARIISTDVPLLFFWTLALLAYVKLWSGGDRRWAIVLGAALGLGLLAKYAMIYFPVSAALAVWLGGDVRRVSRTRWLWITLGVVAVVIIPNLIWNMMNGLVTFRHTGDNIQGEGIQFNAGRAFEFLATQFIVFGPVLFAVLLSAIARIGSPKLTREDRLLLAFAIPPLAFVSVTATVTHANANWAAPAFISGVIVAVALLVRYGYWRSLAVSLAIGVLAQAALLVGDAKATRIHIPYIRKGDVYMRTLGWRAFGQDTGRLARQVGARTIAGEYRDAVATLLYYWRDQPEQIKAWQVGPVPDHHFELTRPLTDAAPQPILFVTYCSSPRRLDVYFSKVEVAGVITNPTGPTSTRTFYAFKLEGLRKPLGPLGVCR
jgi:4-amino-4-deoxy-L-arabinose transferase-like glycosyltransferase